MEFDSRRSAVYSLHGMVATSQPLASNVGLDILKKGGNAADACVAMAAALNVLQPCSTGIGGDMFALYWDASQKKVFGINGSGRCSKDLNLEALAEMGFSENNRPDPYHALWVTVPGAAAGWVDTVDLFGSKKLSLAQLLEPAITLAEEGFPVAPVCARAWAEGVPQLMRGPHFRDMLLNGEPPKAGQIVRLPLLARTFRELAAKGKAGFYDGRIAQQIVDIVTALGGKMTLEDLLAHRSTFDEPICVNYRGVDVYEMPPSGQGITALLALNILEGFEIGKLKFNSSEHLHLLIESMRLAFADTMWYAADPTFEPAPLTGLLSKEYAKSRRTLINPAARLADIEHGHPANSSCTVYFCAVDSEGNACSFINSNYMGFGTGIIPEGCGFTLQNRGHNFSLDPTHRNCLKPNKRPYHTIVPGMAVRNGELMCPFGVMGGHFQAQGHVQVISNMVDFGMDPQQALNAPRIMVSGADPKGRILLEDGLPEEVAKALNDLGHHQPTIVTGWARSHFGVGQIITRAADGVLCAGSDPRHDGQAIGY